MFAISLTLFAAISVRAEMRFRDIILLKIWLIQSFTYVIKRFLYTKQVQSHDAIVNANPSECQANEMFKNEFFNYKELNKTAELRLRR